MNLSKKRFPFRNTGNKHSKPTEYTDKYFVYDLPKNKIGDYLNIWFRGVVSMDDKGRYYLSEVWTVKKMDEKTSLFLYNRRYNPVSLAIYCPAGAKFKTDKDGNTLYNFKAQIHSVDDSSYGMWWMDVTLQQIEGLKKVLMRWLEQQKMVNGDQWFAVGKENNATDFDRN